MPRAQNVSVQNSFARGIITEATALTFPENACTESDNVVFNRIGIAERRLGFDAESLHTSYTASLVGNVVVSYLWANVSGVGDISFVVVQVGNTLHFYAVTSDAALSANKHATTIDLTTFVPSGITTVASLECQFSSGNGLLFVTNPNLNSFYVSYSSDTNAFTTATISLQQRDFEGDTTDALAIDARPASTNLAGLTAAHKYNLQNQGWTDIATVGTLEKWDAARTDMPSNADVSWYFKDTSDNFDFTTVDNRAVGNSAAPKGHYIYSIYSISRSSNVSGATNFTIATDRVSCSAFYAGRVFYGGLKGSNSNAKIFFSQVVQSNTQYGLCYQENDPTSETLFNLLPTDGGVINIIDAGTVYKMLPSLNALVVFASNGVWAISGSQGIGFTANDYTISKISSVRCISSTNFIDVEGTPYWWNLDGIYTLTLDSQTNAMKILAITDTTIKSLFDTITGESKQYARGAYDFFTKRLTWIYKSAPSVSFEDKYVYDRTLTFSLISNAFFTGSIDPTNVQINSIVDITGVGGNFVETGISDSSNIVIDGSNTVTTFVNNSSSIDSTVKYLISYVSSGSPSISFAESFKDTYLDWEFFDSVGQSFISYFITGFKIRGQGMTKFQQNYMNIFLDNSEDSGFKINSLWDYATTGNTGRWSTTQLFSITADDFSTKVRKIKLRGTGLACQFKVSSNGNLPFTVIGWSVFESGNKWP